jgi:signal transduction histidine kinase
VVVRRRLLRGTTNTLDAAIAVAATIAAVVFAGKGYLSAAHYVSVRPTPVGHSEMAPGTSARHLTAFWSLAMAGVVLTTLPLAFRRRYPVTVFCVIMTAVLVTNQSSTAITIVAALFAAYCALVYSSKQWVALSCLLTGLLTVTFAYPKASPHIPSVYTPALLLLPTVALGYLMRMWQLRARESASRLERAQAEHEAATARALDLERARIASELHDVVTHNVSVMVVQAGAARQVLGRSPADARGAPRGVEAPLGVEAPFGIEASLGIEAPLAIEALLAIEASGRNAMTELRHLLSLLAPDRAGEEILRPQPGLDQIKDLVAGVRAAGLTVELTVTGASALLPPGLDLAAYRVVQEALTNVIKHTGVARTFVLISWFPDLEITVSDDGGSTGYAGAGGSYPSRSYTGRGLIGLRERVAIYGGSLDAGPRPGGGWRVRARFPLEQAIELRASA